ncbi:MAG: hypothetical protein RLY43_96 [Bacteroidota bacterium]|jgi:hypothetical protein
MTKLIIDGTYLSYSILEFNLEEAMYLEEIRGKEFVDFDDIFFERKDYQKLGYNNLDDIPLVAHFSGFNSKDDIMSIKPAGALTVFRNGKKDFKSALDRLEERYQHKLDKEFDDFKSSRDFLDFTFRKRRNHKYFLLKFMKEGKFSVELKKDHCLKDFNFIQTQVQITKFLHYPVDFQVLNINLNDCRLIYRSELLNKISSEAQIV